MTDTHPTLPLPVTPLIGRDQEQTALRALLSDGTRLVTLVGPPGVGKTLLAQHLAVDLAGSFPDGAVFVPLETIRDPVLVPTGIARALEVRETPGRSLAEAVRDELAEKQLLLVLDNFEQVIDAAIVVAGLLAACPGLTVLATSRTPLRVRAEAQFPIEPLLVPGNRAEGREISQLGATQNSGLKTQDYASVQLFLARARAVQPSFALTAANTADVSAICTRLDGLPLALELAAARVGLLSAREIAAHLTRRLAFLTHGHRDQPPRHQTLRAAIDWSYELLPPEEQRIFRLLGVFVGGGTLDAIEVVGGGVSGEGAGETLPAPATSDFRVRILEWVHALADHSLIRRGEDRDGASRYRMLETIREYAVERLGAAGEAEDARLHLAAWCLSLAEVANQHAWGPDQAVWQQRLEAEQDNVRAVLQWTLDSGQPTLGLRLAGEFWGHWHRHGHLTESRAWLDRLLARGNSAPASVRAEVRKGAATLARSQGDFAATIVHAEQALALYREIGDRAGVCDILRKLGETALERSDLATATLHFEEWLATARAIADQRRIASSLNCLGIVAARQGRLDEARVLYEEVLEIDRARGDAAGVATVLNNLARLASASGNLERARAGYEEAIAIMRELRIPRNLSIFLSSLADVVRRQGDLGAARRHAEEALTLADGAGDRLAMAYAYTFLTETARALGDLAAARPYATANLELAREIGDARRMVPALWQAAAIAHMRGRAGSATRLFGAASAIQEATGTALEATRMRELEEHQAALRATLGEAAFATAWAEGAATPPDAAIAAALDALADESLPAAPAESRREAFPAGLTAREVEVLRLVAAGQSNRAIAERLVVSERTIEHHIANLYRKIDARGRVDAAAYALRHGLGPAEQG